MPSYKEFPSLHARIYRRGIGLYSLYELGRQLSRRQMQQLIHLLNEKGFPIEELEFFEYGPSDSLRHLFVKMRGTKEAIPYFQLSPECWQAIVEQILCISQREL